MHRLLPLLLAVVLSGCSLFKPAPVHIPLTAAPKGPRPEAIRATAVVELGSEKKIRGRAIITVQTPGAFRVEVLSPFGTPAAVMLSDGEVLSVLKNGRVESYLWTDEKIPYSFSSTEFVSILLGRPPFDPSALDEAGPGAKVTVVTDNEDNSVYDVTTDESGNLTEIIRTSVGLKTLTAAISDFKKVDGFVLPYKISVRDGTRSIKVSYTSVEVNPEIKKEAFRLERSSFD